MNNVRHINYMPNDVRRVLLVVHPGSCCGSADMNLGRYDARAKRDGLVTRINGWRGPIAIIDGALSDELRWPQYEDLGRSIANALRRAKRKGELSTRVWGCDMDIGSGAATRRLIASGQLGSDDEVILTGAWASESDSGCVNAAARALEGAGIKHDTDDSAFFEEDADDDEDDEDGSEEGES